MDDAAAFVGRRDDLERLRAHLDAVRAEGQGRLLSVRGRRQAGKSRLLTQFVAKARLPAFFFTGSRQSTLEADLAAFLADARQRSTLPGRLAFEGTRADSWEAALRLVLNALPPGPAILVLDELPWLVERDPGLEGTLQKLWDTELERRPVLLVLVGSDLAMMEALTSHGRPLFGRPKEMVVHPFHVGDTARMLGTDAAASCDAWLVTGGYPRLLRELRRAASLDRFLADQLADENSDLVVVGLRVLSAEFPVEYQARQVLSAIGSGDRAFTALQTRAGLQASALHRSLDSLRRVKRMVELDLPLSTKASRDSRYRIADPYLRFWLRFVEPSVADIARGRPDLALDRLREGWTAWRGRAVEPLIRESLLRHAAGDRRLGGAAAVGGYWTRTGDVEVDLVGADRAPVGKRIAFVGSIKWREKARFDRADLDALHALRARVPGGAAAKVIAVSRSGFASKGLDAALTPKEIVAAWR